MSFESVHIDWLAETFLKSGLILVLGLALALGGETSAEDVGDPALEQAILDKLSADQLDAFLSGAEEGPVVRER